MQVWIQNQVFKIKKFYSRLWNAETVEKKASVDKEGYTDSNNVPILTKLEYEIENFGSDMQQNIGSIWGKNTPIRRRNNSKDINDL